jgi:aryl-alcohol dehydrogenase-like predicted oxidoreductase
MQSREIGNSGIRASVVGLGCNNFGIFRDAAQATACVHKALDVGITFFDMASEHGQGVEESLVADALGSRRKSVVIATKFGQPELLEVGADGAARMSEDASRQGLSRRWIMHTVEESLRRLGTDYIDLYQPHAADSQITRDETLRALDDLVRQGKVRAIGEAATLATAQDLEASAGVAKKAGLTPFVSMQTQYSLLVRDAEKEIIPALRARNMSLLPYFPLANGVLTGKYRADIPAPSGSRLDKLPGLRAWHGSPEHLAFVEKLRDFVAVRGMEMVELAIGWLLCCPVVASVIAGASTPQQVAQNAAAGETTLSPEDQAELKRLFQA